MPACGRVRWTIRGSYAPFAHMAHGLPQLSRTYVPMALDDGGQRFVIDGARALNLA